MINLLLIDRRVEMDHNGFAYAEAIFDT